MSKYDKLKKKSANAFAATTVPVGNRDKIADETKRVADICYNAGSIISELDREFAKTCQLNNTDISFLFLATALQCVRQYILSNEKFRFKKASDGDKFMKNLIPGFVPKDWKDILVSSVPYDALWLTPEFKTVIGSIGLAGPNHRYKTAGHDPILGWIYGPINILSDSLTMLEEGSFLLENRTTYAVDMDSFLVQGFYPGGSVGAKIVAIQQIKNNFLCLPAAIARQAFHFGTDYFTKQGLPIPLLATVNSDLVRRFTAVYHIDMYSIQRGATAAVLINALISCMHKLFYDEARDGDIRLYEVRTRKILSYSNMIASSSNILYTAISKDLTKLDVGGLLVTLYRVISDYKFIQSLKEEFLENAWHDVVMGSDLNFEI